MSIPLDIKAALDPLVDGRVYPNKFPQEPETPTWPAIRYAVIAGADTTDICGSADVSTDDVRVQFDVVARTYSGMLTLRDQVVTALMGLTPPATRQGYSETWDAETKTDRAILDYTFHQSSTA